MSFRHFLAAVPNGGVSPNEQCRVWPRARIVVRWLAKHVSVRWLGGLPFELADRHCGELESMCEITSPFDQAPAMLVDALAANLPSLRLACREVKRTGIRLWLLEDDAGDLRIDPDTARKVADRPPYWALCWPAGLVLAKYFLANPHALRGKTVVDFGAGSGIVGIAAAKAGAERVIAVDSDRVAVFACQANAAVNGVTLECRSSFGHEPQSWDVVAAADVFYDPANVPLLATLRNMGARLFVADARRRDLERYGLRSLGTFLGTTVPAFDDPQFNTVMLYES